MKLGMPTNPNLLRNKRGRQVDLRDSERESHREVNEDRRLLVHPGYEISYCDKCKRPIIHSRAVSVRDNCGRRECND